MPARALAYVALLLAVASLSLPRSMAQAPQEPANAAHAFLTALTGDVDAAYKTLLEESPLASDPERVKKVVSDTKKLFGPKSAYGSPRKDEAIERIKAERVGNDLAVLRYLYKFDRLPVVWHFTYYRTDEKWVLVGVRFDHEYDSLVP